MGDTHIDYPKGVTFEAVWAALMEDREQMKELREAQKETDRQMKNYNKRFGDFTNHFGELVESLVAPNLLKKFAALGLNFENIYRNAEVSNKKLNLAFEIDLLLEDGDKAMVVEVKTSLETKDVKNHVERLEKMRMIADYKGDKRTFLGAVAGLNITSGAKNYALKQGFYVIEPSGETFNIVVPEGNAKEW